jgi:hypothetical protein
MEVHQIWTREPQSLPTEDFTNMETAKEARYAQPLWGVKGVESTLAISSEG